jgi:hypothetical protein
MLQIPSLSGTFNMRQAEKRALPPKGLMQSLQEKQRQVLLRRLLARAKQLPPIKLRRCRHTTTSSCGIAVPGI